jgi:hypothetical protein
MTLVTFAQRRMIPLRVAAILANLCFIGYGALGHFLPILALHLTLLLVNSQRLFFLLVRRRNRQPAAIATDNRLLGRGPTGDPGGSTPERSRAAPGKPGPQVSVLPDFVAALMHAAAALWLRRIVAAAVSDRPKK